MGDVALVTGAGRGIGLELCRQLLDRGWTVVACPRIAGSPELAEIARAHKGRLHEVPLDVADDDSVAQAAARAEALVEHIDVLFNNAGIFPRENGRLEQLDLDTVFDAFDVNAVGVLRVTRALLPLLRRGRGKRVIQMTSLMGSLRDNSSGGSWAYRLSKAAMNMVTRNLAHELGPEGFICISVHPGWVRTRMGGEGGRLGPRTAVEQVLHVALATGREANGSFKGPGSVDLPF